MRLHWLMGHSLEALAKYRRCVQVLHEELSTPPTAKTTVLYNQMLHRRFDPGQWPVHHHNGLPQRLVQEAAPSRLDDGLQAQLIERMEAAARDAGMDELPARGVFGPALSACGRRPGLEGFSWGRYFHWRR